MIRAFGGLAVNLGSITHRDLDSETTEDLMTSIGQTLSMLHTAQIIHGDLTTSNMMLRPLRPLCSPNTSATSTTTSDPQNRPYEIVLIDFGLSSHSNVPENLAVDLYVLERAFGSTHPTSERLFQGVSVMPLPGPFFLVFVVSTKPQLVRECKLIYLYMTRCSMLMQKEWGRRNGPWSVGV